MIQEKIRENVLFCIQYTMHSEMHEVDQAYFEDFCKYWSEVTLITNHSSQRRKLYFCSITLESFTTYFENNLNLALPVGRNAHCTVWILPVALVPSILLSQILTELSEQPTARQQGMGGQIATEVAARRQFIKISCNTQKCSIETISLNI